MVLSLSIWSESKTMTHRPWSRTKTVIISRFWCSVLSHLFIIWLPYWTTHFPLRMYSHKLLCSVLFMNNLNHQVKMMMMKVIARTIRLHRLILLNFYSFLQRYVRVCMFITHYCSNYILVWNFELTKHPYICSLINVKWQLCLKLQSKHAMIWFVLFLSLRLVFPILFLGYIYDISDHFVVN